jgi:hypothetical protein
MDTAPNTFQQQVPVMPASVPAPVPAAVPVQQAVAALHLCQRDIHTQWSFFWILL